jgi:hypothetical protein
MSRYASGLNAVIGIIQFRWGGPQRRLSSTWGRLEERTDLTFCLRLRKSVTGNLEQSATNKWRHSPRRHHRFKEVVSPYKTTHPVPCVRMLRWSRSGTRGCVGGGIFLDGPELWEAMSWLPDSNSLNMVLYVVLSPTKGLCLSSWKNDPLEVCHVKDTILQNYI